MADQPETLPELTASIILRLIILHGLNIGTNGLVEVNNQLLLTNGIINTTSANKLTLVNTSPSAVIPAGGSSASFVNGPLIKQIVNGDDFLFPTGMGQ